MTRRLADAIVIAVSLVLLAFVGYELGTAISEWLKN
jgi:hypothetical protein